MWANQDTLLKFTRFVYKDEFSLTIKKAARVIQRMEIENF